MKGLKKLALVTAVAAAPFAQAEMTAMDDALLGEMTGQAGITIDIDLALTVGEIKYVDSDGYDTDGNDSGSLSFKNLQVGEIDETGTLAATSLRGITIDADGADGLVIDFGQIGSGLDLTDTADQAYAAAGHYWRGLDVRTDFEINGASAGSIKIDNLTNFVPNALVVEGIAKFGVYTPQGTGLATDLNWTDGANAVDLTQFQTDVASYIAANAADPANYTDAEYAAAQASAQANQAVAFTAGSYVSGNVAIQGGTANNDGTSGLTINAEMGFVIEKMAWIDTDSTGTGEFGVHNFTMFDVDADGNITGFQVNDLTIDVVDHAAANSGQALKIGGATMKGTIAMGDIYIGDHVNGSLGSVIMKDIDMAQTDIYIYGH